MPLVSGTDTYADVAYADAYADLRLNVQGDWFSLLDGEKESALKLALVQLESLYRWKGSIAVDTQGVNWPRSGVRDDQGRNILNTLIPTALKDAQCELAFMWSVADQLMPLATSLTSVDARMLQGPLKREQLGELVKEFFQAEQLTWELIMGGMRRKVFPLVDAMVKPYAKNSIYDMNAELVLF